MASQQGTDIMNDTTPIDGRARRSLGDIIARQPRLSMEHSGLPDPSKMIDDVGHGPSIQKLRPGFYLLKPNVDVALILAHHFPRLVDRVSAMMMEFDMPQNEIQREVGPYILNLFNMEGRMGTREWLTDTDIITGLFMVTLGLHECIWTPQMGFNSRTATSSPRQKEKMLGKRWFVLPENEKNNHWRLLIHDRHPNRNTVFVFDSIQDPMDAQKVHRTYCTWLEKCGFEDRGQPALLVAKQMQQGYNWTCGLHTIDAARVFFREVLAAAWLTWRSGFDLDWANSALFQTWKHPTGDLHQEDQIISFYKNYIRRVLGSTAGGGCLREGDVASQQWETTKSVLTLPPNCQAVWATNKGAALLRAHGYNVAKYHQVQRWNVLVMRTAKEEGVGSDQIRPDCEEGWTGWSFLNKHRMMRPSYI
ncbi:hypothetical protein C8A00DRAFT_38474 [Chaetomidium leptoderma]|uniref:Ubiquitin-like protease family profile domain-containing protein n=1 Tax=Chaetomidium leptoderma TaxID=669021 RepID=A0AAN6ZSZ6_9PEZI|nr:hypothetical protein C8A00DRAFT_38474 [Chaetomidium leptoderma]